MHLRWTVVQRRHDESSQESRLIFKLYKVCGIPSITKQASSQDAQKLETVNCSAFIVDHWVLHSKILILSLVLFFFILKIRCLHWTWKTGFLSVYLLVCLDLSSSQPLVSVWSETWIRGSHAKVSWGAPGSISRFPQARMWRLLA